MIQHTERLDLDISTQNSISNGETVVESASTNGPLEAEASSSGNDMQYSGDLKFGWDELCPVCGDKVSGYHYGLLTCESCKGFFKRTVQNKKVYSCVDNRSCLIDKAQRKRCPFCRFQKCLNVGMKLEAVRQDRMRGGRNKFGPMYKRDRALKQQAIRQQQQMLAQCQMRLQNGMTSPEEDIKPDPAMLQQISQMVSNNMGYSSSNMPSPSMPDSPNSDISCVSSSQPSPVASHPPLSPYTMTQNFHPSSMMHDPRNHYSMPSYQYHHQMAPPIIPIVPQTIINMKANMTDELEIKQKLLTFLHNAFGAEDILNHPNKLLQMICKLSDQLLFLMVEWARTSVYFKELKVEDQMKLLQHSWSEILILDFVHRLVRETWSGEVLMGNGQRLNLECLDKLGLSDCKDKIRDMVRKMKELKIDINEYLCLKYLILLNPDVPGLENREHVEQCQESINAALMEYCINFYPSLKDKFGQVLLRLPEVRLISIRAEEFFYYKHLNNEIPDQTLLIEMLHSKKK